MFWNTKGSPLYNQIRDICREHHVDVAIIGECKLDPVTLVTTLNRGAVAPPFIQLPSEQSRMLFFTRYPLEWFEPRYDETGHVSIKHLEHPSGVSILIVAVHLPSKRFANDDSQGLHTRNLAHVIELQEKSVNHKRTILIGDFNMDPFETNMVIADGLHAVMDRRFALEQGRRVAGKNYQMFYNPMWGHLGDSSIGPPGTFFYNRSQPATYFWHTFDQVLLRPDLIDFFRNTGLQVLTKAGNQELLREAGRIDDRVSDHLPLIISLDIDGSP